MKDKINILVVEDNKRNIEMAKKVFGEKTKVVETLEDGFNESENGSYQVLVTDLFYPTGDMVAREEFNEKLGDAIIDCYIQIGDRGPSSSLETRRFSKSVKEGIADEVPSGALLGIYAMLKKGVIPFWISSHEHHSDRSDFMGWFLLGSFGNYFYAHPCEHFIEGIDIRGIKKWEESLEMVSSLNIESSKDKISKISNENESMTMNLGLVKLAKELPKYFTT